MSADKPPGEDDFEKSGDDEMVEIDQMKEPPTAEKSLGTLNAAKVERVQVSSTVITGTPSTLADLPSTEMQSLLRPQNSNQLTATMEDDEVFRWRGTAHKKATAIPSPQNTDDKAISLTPSVLKDLPSTSTVVSLHLEQPELKPIKANEAFLFAKIRPVSKKKKQDIVKSKPDRPPQQPLKRTSSPARQIVLKKDALKKPTNSPKPQVVGKTKVKLQTSNPATTVIPITKQQPLTLSVVPNSPLPPFSACVETVPPSHSKHNLVEKAKTPGQKKRKARQQAPKKVSPNKIVPQKNKEPFPRKEFPKRPPLFSPKTSGLKSPSGKNVRVAPVSTTASPGNKAGKKTMQTQMATQIKVEKAKTTANSKQTKQNNGLLFTSYIFRPPPKE